MIVNNILWSLQLSFMINLFFWRNHSCPLIGFANCTLRFSDQFFFLSKYYLSFKRNEPPCKMVAVPGDNTLEIVLIASK